MQNRTPDSIINQISLAETRVVVTKDADFVDSLLVRGEPYKLLLISTGNITNNDLLYLIEQNLMQIVDAFDQYTYVELDRTHLTIHR